MERIKTFLASALVGLVVFAGFGFGIMAIGFAIVLGATLALAMRLAGPRIIAEARKQAGPVQGAAAGAEPAGV